ncbi:hypothetical protein [Enterobacter kobei]|uniref:hypothetical protein n=1 Tax=Enterobacter kobei TaxID=208224 RepID=UPI002DBD36FB|nr:hypothetical protein [Enterobacter kobei]MEB7606544.1 hypothetical protein [Enterobacter kobei]
MSISNGTIAKRISILAPIFMSAILGVIISLLNSEIKDKPSIMNTIMSIKYENKTKTEPLVKEINIYRDEVLQLRNTLTALVMLPTY